MICAGRERQLQFIKSEELIMFGFGQLIDILKKDPKKIVFTEGDDPRILEAVSRNIPSSDLNR